MLIALALLAVIAAGALLLLHVQQKAHAQAQVDWALERRELLNRIQRPEQLPVTVPEGWVMPEPETDDSHLIGQVVKYEPDES